MKNGTGQGFLRNTQFVNPRIGLINNNVRFLSTQGGNTDEEKKGEDA